MSIFVHNGKEYEVDSYGFLINPKSWDDNFAEGMAHNLNIPGGLNNQSWKIIRFIRDTYERTNSCPVVYDTCLYNDISLHELKSLFPDGYQRGACRIAGVAYQDGFLRYHDKGKSIGTMKSDRERKKYTVDTFGFLINSDEWDKNFAILKADELKMPSLLTDKHWEIISYLREKFKATDKIPTVYETCEDNDIKIEEFKNLFPDGYHRGAVKIAGLRLP